MKTQALDLAEYFRIIKNYNYALCKIDVPYMPKNFPTEYPVGKDMDMFTSQTDYKKICDITRDYFLKYNQFNIVLIEEANNFRLRLENNGTLHYQIDITSNSDMICDRVLANDFYMLSFQKERKIREEEINKNPHKLHHKIWLQKNDK